MQPMNDTQAHADAAQMLQQPFKAVVIGSSGAIGQAFVRALEKEPHCVRVHAISRAGGSGLDLLDEASMQTQAALAQPLGPFDVVIDATGALVLDGQMPEKSLAQLSQDRLLQSLAVNAVGPALVMKHFAPLLVRGPSIYAKLSARVGSISDNQLGGWYGYRAAKAALNMYLQTAAIELQRTQPLCRVVALQPGTVDSALSKPFQANVANLLTPDASVNGMLQALKQLPIKKGAHFIDHQGRNIAW